MTYDQKSLYMKVNLFGKPKLKIEMWGVKMKYLRNGYVGMFVTALLISMPKVQTTAFRRLAFSFTLCKKMCILKSEVMHIWLITGAGATQYTI